MAHTPTVKGNCTSAVSRKGPPLGRKKVSKYMATAVMIPSISLLFQFMMAPARFTHESALSDPILQG